MALTLFMASPGLDDDELIHLQRHGLCNAFIRVEYL